MQNILVTGATRGLGLSIADFLSASGYHIIATGRQPTDALSALTDRDSEGKVSFHPFDLSDTSEIRLFIRDVTKTHGPLYGLVNNAALGFDGVLATMHDSQIETLMQVNVLAPILVAKYASRSMLPKRTGRIINIASIIATTGFSGLSVYAATKSSMIGFTKSLAREIGKANITVNTISPGYMQTDMTDGLSDEKLAMIERRSPLGRLASVDDVAAAVGYLLSPQASAITGTNLTIDAGSTA